MLKRQKEIKGDKKMNCIYIVEGNPHLRALLAWHLQQKSYVTQQYATIQKAKDNLLENPPKLMILDSDLPDGDGIKFCRWLYKSNISLVLMLSARTMESDIVNGLEAGADDYLCKPFGMKEFLARVEALLRRFRVQDKKSSSPSLWDFGDLKIDVVQRRVQFKEESIELTPQEFSLLYILAQAQGNPLSRKELLSRAWPETIDNPRTIDTHVLSLRKKIEIDPRQPNLIQTVRNVGYRFNLDILNYHNKVEIDSNNNHSDNHFKKNNNLNGNRINAELTVTSAGM